MKTEAGIGALEPPEAKKDPSWRLCGERGPANSLASDLWRPELQTNAFLFSPTRWW